MPANCFAGEAEMPRSFGNSRARHDKNNLPTVVNIEGKERERERRLSTLLYTNNKTDRGLNENSAIRSRICLAPRIAGAKFALLLDTV